MPRVIIKTLILFVASIVSFFVSTTNVKAVILFQDNFNNPTETLLKWNFSGPALWKPLNNEFGVLIDGAVTNALPSNSYWNSLWQNFIFTVDLKGVQGTDKNVLIKYIDENNFYEIHHTGGYIFLDKTVSGSGSQIVPKISYPLDNGVWYHFKIEVNKNHFIISENETILFDTNITGSTFSGGKPGLRVGTGAVSPSEVWYDNVLITDLATPTPTESPTPTPTLTPTATPSPTPSSTSTPTQSPSPTPYPYPSLNVLDLKQYDSRWKSLIYDNANNWSGTPTIKRWGCALTSASMILNYYGFNALPDKLNIWLKNQPDGYLSNGLLNWLAISRYSKLFSSRTLPTLEFKRLGNNPAILINELTNNRPSILEVPGHFIVAKSQTDSSFGINDPGYSNRPTLLSYSNAFKSMRSFTPSHTDLSYILLTIDQIFNLTVLDSKGNEITANTYIDNPLIDDIDNLTTSGNPLKVFEFPKPPSGEYSIVVQGNGEYTLTSYLYDKNGNVTKNTTHKTIENGTKDVFNISMGKKNFFNKEISLKQIFEDLNKFHDRKLITNYAYKDIKRELQAVEDLIHIHKYDLAEKFLNLIKREIKIFTPWAIKSEASKILIQDIEDLIKLF